MKILVSLLLASLGATTVAQRPTSDFKLALTDHTGQLSWHAEGFKIVQSSAKPLGHEVGIRGEDKSRDLSFLGFLFLSPEGAPLTSAKCRDQVISFDKKNNPNLQSLRTSELTRSSGLPVALITYSAKGSKGIEYVVRGFIASDDICGDLEFYSNKPISDQDPGVAAIFSSYQFEPAYKPAYKDIFLYAQILYQNEMFKAAAPVFEKAMTMIPSDGAPFSSALVATRVTTDQAGMAYGISGDTKKARSIFEAAIKTDPDFPMYYYNLACADAQDGNVKDARGHLQQAFDRKASVNDTEPMPDPTKDDSFLPYKNDKEFWRFVESLQSGSVPKS
jgi:tetratricopeptide (TPR) repeat protein